MCTYSPQLLGRRNQTVALTHQPKFYTVCVCVCVCVCAGEAGGKVQYVHVSVGLAQVAERHSVLQSVSRQSWKLKSVLRYACAEHGAVPKPAKTHIPSKKIFNHA